MSFVAALNAQQNSDWKLVQLNEDIFDFQLETGDEKRYLELQEIVIPGKKRGPPYAPEEQVIHSPKFAKTFLAEITSKAIRYSAALSQPLHLLVYTTHWRFLPNEVVLKLVARALEATMFPFDRIYFFTRHDVATGRFVLLFPNKDLIKDFSPQQFKDHRYVNFDLGSGVAVAEGDQVGVRFNLSPDATKKLGISK
jgi:hypothetical protein